MAPILLIFIIEFLPLTEAMNDPCLFKSNIDAALIGGAAGGVCLLIIVIIVVVVCLLKRRKNKQHNKPSARRTGDSGYENCHPDESITDREDAKHTQINASNNDTDKKPDDMIILENDRHISIDSVPNTSTTNNSNGTGQKGTRIPDDMIILENPMYVSVDSLPKSEKSNGQRDKPNHQSTVHKFSVGQSSNPNDVYAVVNKKPKATDKPSKPTRPTQPSKPIKPPKPCPQTKPSIAVKPPVPKKPIAKL